jgi:predicted nucleic-acid-binding Zn-ribbon protein
VAYICRRCGFTELFTMNPQEIPIGAEHGTQLFSFDSAYR